MANGAVHYWISLITKIEKISKTSKFFTSFNIESNRLFFSLMNLLCQLFGLWMHPL